MVIGIYYTSVSSKNKRSMEHEVFCFVVLFIVSLEGLGMFLSLAALARGLRKSAATTKPDVNQKSIPRSQTERNKYHTTYSRKHTNPS